MEQEFDIDFKRYLNEILGKDPIHDLDEEGECEAYLEVGSKLSINLMEDMISLLTERDSLLIILRFPSESKRSFKGVTKGKVKFGFQIFKKEEFDLHYDFAGFTLSIEGAVEFSDMRLDFNYTPDSFEFSKGLDYSLNIIAVDEESVIKAMRNIRLPRELCKIIREWYINIICQDYNREIALRDIEKLDTILFDGITSKQVEESFSLYTFTDKPEKTALDKYIDD